MPSTYYAFDKFLRRPADAAAAVIMALVSNAIAAIIVDSIVDSGSPLLLQNDTLAGAVTISTDWSPVFCFHAARMASMRARFSALSR